MKNIRHSRVPASRLDRMLRLGKLAGGVAATAVNQSIRQWSRGQRPTTSDLLLQPANAQRLSAQLRQMRGAVLKIGQLLSMEAGELLPPELTELLADLRDRADAMPEAQLFGVLETNLGSTWRQRFLEFESRPFAAASIGQVHRAVDLRGRRLAIKVQYPGVAASIDSDIGNVALLFKLPGLLPDGLDINALLEIARQQLHEEADYRKEADNLKRYRHRLGADPVFRVPEIIDSLSGTEVLAMEYIDGDSIERIRHLPAPRRNQLASRIIGLTLREFLHWGLVQSDPNFANFLYDPDTGRIGLLDFGALRINEATRAPAFARLLVAAIERDLPNIVDSAIDLGYLDRHDDFNARMTIADLVMMAAEPARQTGPYDFTHAGLAQRLGEQLHQLRDHEVLQRVPPADLLFLHRKLGGIYLLCARINARVDVRACIDEVLDSAPLQVAS